jgi:hypothetical protein
LRYGARKARDDALSSRVAVEAPRQVGLPPLVIEITTLEPGRYCGPPESPKHR